MIDLASLQGVISVLNLRCGSCQILIPRDRICGYRDVQTGQEGLMFMCHGETDRLVLSEATSRVPRRLMGWRPFAPLPKPNPSLLEYAERIWGGPGLPLPIPEEPPNYQSLWSDAAKKARESDKLEKQIRNLKRKLLGKNLITYEREQLKRNVQQILGQMDERRRIIWGNVADGMAQGFAWGIVDKADDQRMQIIENESGEVASVVTWNVQSTEEPLQDYEEWKKLLKDSGGTPWNPKPKAPPKEEYLLPSPAHRHIELED